MDTDQMIEKFKVNVSRGHMFSHPEVWDLMEDLGDRWRTIWEELPTDGLFDQLYATSGMYEAFIYADVLFERKAIDPETRSWEHYGDEDSLDGKDAVLEWLLDHPPFECCVPVADLRRHAKGFVCEDTPWKLYLKLTGYIHDSDINMSMLPIGGNDAVYIGNAITAWGEYADVIDTYIGLLRKYGGV